MSNFYYYQVSGGEEKWSAAPTEHRHHVQTEQRPMFFTVLSVSKLVEDLPYEEKLKLMYEGPLYFDFDSEDEEKVIEKVQQFMSKLEELRVNLGMCRFYATGGRGYHIEIPWKLFIDKPPKIGIMNLAAIYREIALELCVDTLDLRVYSQGRGRMWRQPNVQRPNGRYKVPVSAGEMKVMTPQLCQQLTSSPRQELPILSAEFCVPLSILYSKCAQKVEELAKRRSKIKPDPKAREKAYCDSIQWMMDGLGIKAGVGFQELSTQLAVAATTAGLSETDFVSACSGLINGHQGDGSRYNSPGKREEELRRMWRYMEGNLCYEFSVGAIKSLLTHSAPDLDGITSTKEEIKEVIDEAARDLDADGETVDEYADVAKGVTLAKFGTYLDTEYGKKRICAISFTGTNILRSCENGQIAAYTTNIMVNGKAQGKQTIELEVFASLTNFTRLASRYGHAFQGNDVQVRSMMMRFVEQAKKRGSMQYICKREGVDLLHIDSHLNPELRIPFLLWADAEGVITEPRITATGQGMIFAGYPDARGIFRSDLRDAPPLFKWVEEPGNRDELRTMLKNLVTCQRSEMLGKIIGWYVACFYKQIFNKVYGKFPLLHVNGGAGAGKTENILSMANFFYYMNEAKALTQGGTTPFAMQQHISASASIPLIIDEYKPHAMSRERHDGMKAMFRDAYNQREVSRGGGTRDSDDFRSLHQAQLSAPIVFIAEAAEDEAAVMERVVLVTLIKPAPDVAHLWLARFTAFRRNKHFLGILGSYIAGSIVNSCSLESVRDEFDALYDKAKDEFLITASDLAGGISAERLEAKQSTKERSVYNHTVAKFGLQQFRKLVNAALGDKSLDGYMEAMEKGIYERMDDLTAATTPEHVKVLSVISSMSHHVEKDRNEAIRKGEIYAYVLHQGEECIEIALRPAYHNYRGYCRAGSVNPLFASFEAFAYAIKDSPAFRKQGIGETLQTAGVYTLAVAKLSQLGVEAFKG